jgi:hypothetical protein
VAAADLPRDVVHQVSDDISRKLFRELRGFLAENTKGGFLLWQGPALLFLGEGRGCLEGEELDR